MIAHLKEKGFKVVVIMDPGIKADPSYPPYQEGFEQNLFVNYPDGQIYEAQVWPGWCAFPDFTKAATRGWWEEKMAFYTEAGVDGFWTDMNEPASWGQCTPNLLEFDFDGEKASHRKARNVYGMQMARSTQAGSLLHAPKKRPFVLTRSGFAGIQRYAAAWTGDNVASEEHMLAGIRLVTSLGMSGVAFAGYDVGGFAGGLGFILIYFIQEPWMLHLCFALVGISWASILSMPYAMLSGSVEPKKMGVYMGIFNMFIVLPQIVAALVGINFLYKLIFGEEVIYTMVLAGVLLMLAGFANLLISDRRATHDQ